MATEYKLNCEACQDFLEIHRLNGISKRAWERNQESGSRPETYEANDKMDEAAWKQAQALGAKHGWTLQAPGLYWEILDASGREIR